MLHEEAIRKKRGLPEALVQLREVRAFRVVMREEILVEPRPQHIHAVVAVLEHGVSFLIRPAGISDGELGEVVGRRLARFSRGVGSRFVCGKVVHFSILLLCGVLEFVEVVCPFLHHAAAFR